MSGLTDRERFCAMLYNGPLRRADVICVLSGDGTMRLDAAVGLLWQGAARDVVVSGGIDNPPHSLNAEASAEYLTEKGLSPDRIILDGAAQHTRDSAEWLADTCAVNEWQTVLLVTSPYHMPRAFLTALASLQSRDMAEDVLVLPVPASQVEWYGKPAGLDVTRMDLLAGEYAKIDEYHERGHVASYEDGLAYLKDWEGAE